MEIVLNDAKAKYIQIYEQIAHMINQGILKSEERLPSKRELAFSLNVSLNTVINAYNLLAEEGYIYSMEKKGYYVSSQPIFTAALPQIRILQETKNEIRYDFTTQNTERFSNEHWKKITRETLDTTSFLAKSPLLGNPDLRESIRRHLYTNRGISAEKEQIIIGTGIELFESILSVTGINRLKLENPGYHKLSHIAQNLGFDTSYLPIDEEGVIVPKEQAVLYTTPFNQFPTGIKMSIARKKELLHWAVQTDSLLIEDDFDAEFRINSAPTTALYSLNPHHVIFFSTFSATLYPGLRISYAILPPCLLEKYITKYRQYTCPAASLEQMVLKEFLDRGYYAKHMNRKKRIYLQKREDCIQYLKEIPFIRCDIKKNYLSLLLEITSLKDCDALIERLKEKGIAVQSLSGFDVNHFPSNILILGYTAIPRNKIREGLEIIIKEIKAL